MRTQTDADAERLLASLPSMSADQLDRLALAVNQGEPMPGVKWIGDAPLVVRRDTFIAWLIERNA
jgi:hypothetical protein